jgi:hypothetical protein
VTTHKQGYQQNLENSGQKTKSQVAQTRTDSSELGGQESALVLQSLQPTSGQFIEHSGAIILHGGFFQGEKAT